VHAALVFVGFLLVKGGALRSELRREEAGSRPVSGDD
jgi:hypothetical protein